MSQKNEQASAFLHYLANQIQDDALDDGGKLIQVINVRPIQVATDPIHGTTEKPSGLRTIVISIQYPQVKE